MITTPEQMRAEAATIAEDYEFLDHPKDHREIIKACVRHIAAEISDIDIVVLPATDWTACAADMLRVWDTWVSGSSEGDRDSAQRLATAASFAEQAFDHAHTNTNNIIAARAPAAMFRAFLLALIDPLHPDLDYLRADQAAGEKAIADRSAVAIRAIPAAPQPVAVTVKPLVWVRGIVHMAIPQPGMRYVARPTTPRGCWAWWLDGAERTRSVERDEATAKAAAQADYEARILSALTIHPADPLSDPRVVALVEAAQHCDDEWSADPNFLMSIKTIRKLRAALRAIGGEA